MSIIQLLFYNNPTSLEVTGGIKYTPGNGYIYHVFLEPGSFDVTNGPITAEMLLVAGGGSGGYAPGYGTGGGGAGGVRNITSIPVGDGFYPVVVGSGGLSPGTSMSAGSPSSALGYESIGGGRGNGTTSAITPENNGGSGGGNTTTPPSGSVPLSGVGIPGQGNSGGLGYGPPLSGAGGGGGGRGVTGSNGSQGTPTSYAQAGKGGNGSPFPAYAAPLFPDMPADWATAVGANGYYGGGGGGGNANNPSSAFLTTASGGLGGGGSGYNWRPSSPPNLVATPSTPGVDYTGGGGGGGNESNLRSGGTGIVIIRYAV